MQATYPPDNLSYFDHEKNQKYPQLEPHSGKKMVPTSGIYRQYLWVPHKLSGSRKCPMFFCLTCRMHEWHKIGNGLGAYIIKETQRLEWLATEKKKKKKKGHIALNFRTSRNNLHCNKINSKLCSATPACLSFGTMLESYTKIDTCYIISGHQNC